MKTWNIGSTTVHEVSYDCDLHAFEVYHNDDYVGTVYPGAIADMVECANALNNGSDPIAEMWDDGAFGYIKRTEEADVNTHGYAMIALQEASNETTCATMGSCIQLMYDMDDGEVIAKWQFGNNCTCYHSDSIVYIDSVFRSMTMQEIADLVASRLREIVTPTQRSENHE